MLSIVISTLNCGSTLREALRSIAPVLGATRYQVLVADGGSSDNTLELARAAGALILPGVDRSLYEGLNKGLDAAEGDYLLFLNADDGLLQGSLCDLAGWLAPAPVEMVTGEAEIRRGQRLLWRSRNARRPMSERSILFGVPCLNARIFQREALLSLGGFRPEVGLAADREFLLRTAHAFTRRLSLPRLIFRYRSTPGSRTIAFTPASRRRVHRANLRLAARLKALPAGDLDRPLAEALERLSMSSLSHARQLGWRAVLRALLRGPGHDPQLGAAIRAAWLHRTWHGRAAGW